MEGSTPRCCVGVGRLYEADKVVGAVLVVIEFVKQRLQRKWNRGDVIIRWSTGDANKIIRRRREDSGDFVKSHCEGGTSVGGISRGVVIVVIGSANQV